MPPKRAKQTASNRSSADAPVPKSTEPQAQTPPQNSPQKQNAAVGITQAQKQALIDNLQVEVTERARRLRAQYASQAASLRTRLEMRVNRIPQALRKRKMGDLLDEFAQKEKPVEPPAPQAISVQRGQEEEQAGKVKRGVKRASDQISTSGPEETGNTTAEPNHQDLANPKKRTKTTALKPATTAAHQANTKASRSRNPLAAPTSTILSPKSHNSRTLPRSPFKAGGSPEKPSIQLVQPAKPATVGRTGARTASRQQTTRKAPAVASSEVDGRSSGVSDSSAGTTIVKPVTKGRAAPAKKPAATTKVAVGAAAAKKTTAAARKENLAPVAGGRSLRSKRA